MKPIKILSSVRENGWSSKVIDLILTKEEPETRRIYKCMAKPAFNISLIHPRKCSAFCAIVQMLQSPVLVCTRRAPTPGSLTLVEFSA